MNHPTITKLQDQVTAFYLGEDIGLEDIALSLTEAAELLGSLGQRLNTLIATINAEGDEANFDLIDIELDNIFTALS